jgi:hypothetical protein
MRAIGHVGAPASVPSYLTSLLHPFHISYYYFSSLALARNIAWPMPMSCGTSWRTDYSHSSVCLHLFVYTAIRIYPLLSECSRCRRVRLPDFPLEFLTVCSPRDATLMFGEQLCVSLSPSSHSRASLPPLSHILVLRFSSCLYADSGKRLPWCIVRVLPACRPSHQRNKVFRLSLAPSLGQPRKYSLAGPTLSPWPSDFILQLRRA